MNVESILAKLDRVVPVGEGWKARCPAHHDKNPSLSISLANGGKVLLHCHAGCKYEEVISALGLAAGNLSRNGTGKKQIVAVYDYPDEDGKLLYQTVRYQPKNFKQRRPDGTGGWLYNLKGVRRVLYNLREVLLAALVLVVEGEKDVETARVHGFVATCNPMGAGKWRPDYGWSLSDKHVVIVPDNDKPGLEHAEKVARSVFGKAASVKVAKLPDGVKDLSEWPNLSREELQEFIGQATDWKPSETLMPPTVTPEVLAPETCPGRHPITELSNAERLALRFGAEIRYPSDRRVWMAWNGKHWQTNDQMGVQRRMQEIAKGIYTEAANEPDENVRPALGKWAMKSESQGVVQASIDAARSLVEVRKFSDVFDRDRRLLCVANGTLELRDPIRFREHRRRDFVTKLSPIEYRADATCPQFDRFMLEIFGGNQSLVDYVLRLCGYFLTGETGEQKWWFLYGRGASGKSTLIRIVHGIMGPYAMALPEGYFLLKNQDATDYFTANLVGVRFASCVETNEGRRLNVSRIKTLTGEDEISAALKYQNNFQFTPTAKLVLVANDPPHAPAGDDALWRRLKVVPFSTVVPEEKRVDGLAEKLIQAEGPGILNRFLAGFEAWNSHKLAEPRAVADAVANYRRSEDIAQDFYDDRLRADPDPGARVAAKHVYAAYLEWAKEGNLKAWSKTKLTRELIRLGMVRSDDDRYWLSVCLAAER